MTSSLLTTKLFIPTPSTDLVVRSRLFDRLNDGETRKLTLISAPAGFGKSTLLSEWTRNINKIVTWLSIDKNDNNLKRFLTYFIVALQKVDESIGRSILPTFEGNDNPPLEPLITILINEISASKNEFYIVIDDYHLITLQTIHDAIDLFLAHLPATAHLVISGRIDPPFSLARLRARGEMIEIRAEDLRFTMPEVTAFLNDLAGLGLASDDILALLSRTEGWITGLKLAALSMRGRQDTHKFITAFSGNHHYIIDYLVDEVMSRQPEEIQSFLLQTSILDRFNTALCNRVLGINNSKEILRNLDDSNLFLISLDDERHWYRYHHLFSDFLNQRLNEKESEIIPELHRRASEWLAQNNLVNEAIDHSLIGEDYEQAAQLVENIGPSMMMQSEFDRLTQWLEAMPKSLVENWPWLCIIWAWIYDRWAQFDMGEQYLQHAETALENTTSKISEDAEKIILGQIAAIRALYTLKKGQIPQSIEYSIQALAYLPKGYFNRGVASFSLGWAKKAQGDLSGAIQAYEEGRRASLGAGNRILAQVIILDIGKIQSLQGHLHQASESFSEAIQFTYEKTDIKIPYASSASIGMADILVEWNELDEAMKHIQEGIEIGIASKIVDTIAAGYASLALVYLAKGDIKNAIQTCEKAERMIKDIPDLEADTLSRTLESRVRLLLAQDKVADAAKIAHEKGLRVDTEINYLNLFEHFLLVRILIRLGRDDSASQELSDVQILLTKILEITKLAGYMRRRVEALALQALVFEAQGENDQALSVLTEVISLAEPESYVRTFVDEGDPMKKMLRNVVSGGNNNDYVRRLLAEFEKDGTEHSMVSQPLVEYLSNRELDVLKLLDTELSGPEIAQELMVSLNTIRTHTKNIYAKLGVNNRRAAVSQAKKLEII